MAWKSVSSDIRSQTWSQSVDVTSDRNGAFSCDIILKEKDPSYLKPRTGGYSDNRVKLIKLQWQANGSNPGLFKVFFTKGTDGHDGSFLVNEEHPARNNWRLTFRGFPNIGESAGVQIGRFRVWGSGAPANTYLGSMIAKIETMDKFPCS